MKNVLNEWEVNKWSDDRSMEVKLPTLLGYYDGPTDGQKGLSKGFTSKHKDDKLID